MHCGEHFSGRLMLESLCTACWNRRLEITAGRNGKGRWPKVAAAGLRRVEAIIAADQDELREFMDDRHRQTKVAQWHLIDEANVLLVGIFASRSELEGVLARLLPSGCVVAFNEAPITPPKT